MMRRLRSTVGALVVAAALLFVPGCQNAVAGHWNLVRALPSREVFALDDVQFNRDGTYSADSTLEGKSARESGTYTFNGFELSLRPHAGGQRTYNAALVMNSLEITDKNKDRKVQLEKGR